MKTMNNFMNNEIQVATIDNLSGYKFLSSGQIVSLYTNKEIGFLQPNGYIRVTLTFDDGTVSSEYAHRMIYKAFKGDIPKGMTINHMNEQKADNAIDNLQVMSFKDNCNYGSRNKRISEKLKKYYELKRIIKEILN